MQALEASSNYGFLVRAFKLVPVFLKNDNFEGWNYKGNVIYIWKR